MVRLDVELATMAVGVAGDGGMTVYDAAYVACARRNGWSLVSGDLRHLVRPGFATTPDAAAASAP